jgi:4-hydroxy-3-methylbut-2-enyl diphosphate reductase
MEVILAKQAGFCFGVQRATHLAFEAAEKAGPTYTLGPIIHSPQVVQKLENMGVKVLKDLQGVDDGTVIIRSHGVTAAELAAVVERELQVVDATCPFVKKAQEHVRRLSADGYTVVVVGDADHPEVAGIVSYATGPVLVARSGEDMAPQPRMAKVGVVAQTTQSYEHLESVVCECLKKTGELRIFNTICDATAVRQAEAMALARQVDCMIVIGGYNSANTRRLAELCAALQPQTHHLETAEQLDAAWFVGVTKVGVTAGASTPKWLIDEVIARIRSLDGAELNK